MTEDLSKPVNIFVPNYSDRNFYEPCTTFGEPVFMTKGIVMESAENLHKKFAKFFSVAIPGDFLMLSGSHLVCSIAYAEWEKRFPEQRSILIFNSYKKIYYDVLIEGISPTEKKE